MTYFVSLVYHILILRENLIRTLFENFEKRVNNYNYQRGFGFYGEEFPYSRISRA